MKIKINIFLFLSILLDKYFSFPRTPNVSLPWHFSERFAFSCTSFPLHKSESLIRSEMQIANWIFKSIVSLRKVGIGVLCAATPWNWPKSQKSISRWSNKNVCWIEIKSCKRNQIYDCLYDFASKWARLFNIYCRLSFPEGSLIRLWLGSGRQKKQRRRIKASKGKVDGWFPSQPWHRKSPIDLWQFWRVRTSLLNLENKLFGNSSKVRFVSIEIGFDGLIY